MPAVRIEAHCDLISTAHDLLFLSVCEYLLTKQDAKGERVTIDLAFAGSRGASLQVVTEQSPPSFTSEPMWKCLSLKSDPVQ